MREKWLSIVGAIALAGLILVLVIATQSSAAPSQADCVAAALPTDPDFEVYDQRLPWTNEQHPDVAYNPDKDEYLVVFDWDFNGGGDHDVMGITVTAAGVPAQNPIPISTGTTYDDAYPTVAYNPHAGSYLVAWQRSHNAEAYYAIGGSIVAETAGAPFIIYWTTHGAQRYPDVAYGPGPRRFLVVWENHGPYTLPPDIFGATLDGAGSNIQSIRISPDDTTPGEQTYPAVANNGSTGRWLVVWNDTRTGGTTGHDIYGQQVQYASGSVSLWSSIVPIGTIAAEAGAPAVDWGPVGSLNGEFLTAWVEGVNYVYARRIRANNTLVGDPITVSNTDIDKSDPAVACATASNDWWVVWEDG
jgi:hypothetical protein